MEWVQKLESLHVLRMKDKRAFAPFFVLFHGAMLVEYSRDNFCIESGYIYTHTHIHWDEQSILKNIWEGMERRWQRREKWTVLRGWWSSLLCTKWCKIAVCPPSIDHRRWVLTSSHGCIWILKCNLKKQEQRPTFYRIMQWEEDREIYPSQKGKKKEG